ncbi:hypothetical protein BH09BAC1_BH09BAC1_24130 [soil metagenome]
MLENLKQSTLAATSTLLHGKGYTQDLQIDADGLYSMEDKTKHYSPAEVRIRSVIRFEGASDPGDNAAIYVIELVDGVKGQLIDAYGIYSDRKTGEFLKQCNFDYDASTDGR